MPIAGISRCAIPDRGNWIVMFVERKCTGFAQSYRHGVEARRDIAIKLRAQHELARRRRRDKAGRTRPAVEPEIGFARILNIEARVWSMASGRKAGLYASRRKLAVVLIV